MLASEAYTVRRARGRLAAFGWTLTVLAVAAAAYHLAGARQVALFGVGLAIGAVLLHTEFGFTGSLRRFVAGGDREALRAPLALLALTTLALAPALAAGEAFGQSLGPASAPLAMQVAAGAFIFGVGMQLGGGCGSGTLFSLGGGNGRMLVVIVFFCLGSFLASLHMGWWAALPALAPVVLGEQLGWPLAAGGQAAVIGLLWWWLGRARADGGPRFFAPAQRPDSRRLWLAVLALPLLNLATLMLAGHPWTITWAYALWGAKAAVALGRDPSSAPFWQGAFQSAALRDSVLADVTSLMNIGLVLGATGAALASGLWSVRIDLRAGALISAVAGGFLMGYGARIGFGCTIGALLSGIASTSLHGWLWFAAVLPGTWLGARLRPRFGL